LAKLILAILILSVFIPFLVLPEDPSASIIPFWGISVLLIGLFIFVGIIYLSLTSHLKIHEFKTHGEKPIDLIFSTKRKKFFMKLCQLDGVEMVFLDTPEKPWRSEKGGTFRI